MRSHRMSEIKNTESPHGGQGCRLSGSSSGFTLVELLVVITIIGILIALLLPAVQAAREAARRMQCGNNMKQLALAMHNYHSTNSILPAGAYCSASPSYTHGTIYGCHNWLESLLPYIEQQSFFDQIDFKVNTATAPNAALLGGFALPSLTCPTDPNAGIIDRSGLFGTSRPVVSKQLGESYAPNGGPMQPDATVPCVVTPWPNADPAPLNKRRNCYQDYMAQRHYGSHGLFAAGFGIAYRLEDCKDGTSNTFLLGEQLPAYAMQSLYFHSHRIVLSTNIPPNYQNVINCPVMSVLTTSPGSVCQFGMEGFKSAHSGGLNMAMADGSVTFINESIDYPTWVFLSSRDEGEAARVP